jgi:hypothetical protein
MATGDPIQLTLTGQEELTKRLDALLGVVDDLRPLWEQLIADFYKEQKTRFQLSGAGRYKDLAPSTKVSKQRLYGFVYPILFATGELAASLTSRGAAGALAVSTPRGMILGTRVKHAVYHHSTEPRSKIPRRPLWDEEPDTPMFKRWIRLADVYLQKAAQGALDGKGRSGSTSSSDS